MDTYTTQPFNAFKNEWALVTAGVENSYNTMTIGWGGMGTLWGKPVVTVYIKPCRYTYEFMEKNDYFTVSFYPEEYKKDLGILGTKSGRDGDKVKLTRLTPKKLDKGMTFEEAKVTIVCKKIYYQDLDINVIPEEVVERNYKTEAPHRVYIGEVVEMIEE